ncbi:MAG: hypothetical protein ACLQVD_01925 [Capsulimonadaceae bacterium]
MSKARKVRHAFPISAAMVLSFFACIATGCVATFVLYEIPDTPVHNIVELVRGNYWAGIMSSDLFQQFLDGVDWYELLVVSPLSMLALGITVGILLREDYGTAKLYRTAGFTAALTLLLALACDWTMQLSGQGWKLKVYNLPPSFIAAQLFGLVFWSGIAVIGAEIGRRLGLKRESQAPSPAA